MRVNKDSNLKEERMLVQARKKSLYFGGQEPGARQKVQERTFCMRPKVEPEGQGLGWPAVTVEKVKSLQLCAILSWAGKLVRRLISRQAQRPVRFRKNLKPRQVKSL